MKITTGREERMEKIINVFWEIAGGAGIFILCFVFWCLAVALGN